ncbi:MAG: hypothetical protein MUC81_09385 [Bacteroidia bacterium]|jgi:hypothetical protein|nr:hypothetical protein [Bacteroidia bacterium]
MTSSPVQLCISGSLPAHPEYLLEHTQQIVNGSGCRLLDFKVDDEYLCLFVKAYSEKLLNLLDRLKQSGVYFDLKTEVKLQAASEQYSVFRDITVKVELTAG